MRQMMTGRGRTSPPRIRKKNWRPLERPVTRAGRGGPPGGG
ncbi:hypothetical protein ABIB91_006876, partial [Bradyrhizobium sp. JR4.3]